MEDDYDDLVTCEWCSSGHKIQLKRLEYHWLILKKNGDACVRNLRECQYNKHHKIHKKSLQKHYAVECEDAKAIRKQQKLDDEYRQKLQQQKETLVTPSKAPATSAAAAEEYYSDEENWDDDDDDDDGAGSYLPANIAHQPMEPKPSGGITSSFQGNGSKKSLSCPNETQDIASTCTSKTPQSCPTGIHGAGENSDVAKSLLTEDCVIVNSSKVADAVSVEPKAPEGATATDAEKRIKYLQKKLKEIRLLEENSSPLNEDQVAKLARKEEFTEELKTLQKGKKGVASY